MAIVTITSQGQITLPNKIRRQMGLKTSDKIQVDYNPQTRRVSLQKQMTLDEITTFVMGKVKTGAQPVTNADEYYQKHRGESI